MFCDIGCILRLYNTIYIIQPFKSIAMTKGKIKCFLVNSQIEWLITSKLYIYIAIIYVGL